MQKQLKIFNSTLTSTSSESFASNKAHKSQKCFSSLHWINTFLLWENTFIRCKALSSTKLSNFTCIALLAALGVSDVLSLTPLLSLSVKTSWPHSKNLPNKNKLSALSFCKKALIEKTIYNYSCLVQYNEEWVGKTQLKNY